MNLSYRLVSTVSMVMLLSGASAAIAQKVNPALAKPAAAAETGEWERIKEGLRRAKPMPVPSSAPGVRSISPSISGGTLTFNPLNGSTSAPAATPQSLFGTPLKEGNPGIQPKILQGSKPAAPEASVEGAGTLGVQPSLTASPASVTPPSPYTTPYAFPFNSYGRLLMRFNDGTSDYYYLCSASTASSHHMISAGHCVYNHDIRNDGSNIAGWAAEVWAWVAETDVVDPVDPNNWPDFPYGVAKMTYETSYNAWINNSDFNWDFSFINLDRRIGDHVGWIAREWGRTTTSLNFDGYPAEAPYVASNNPFQYPGYDAGNVQGYTCCRIKMSAYTYGGHSGGPVWRYDSASNSRYLEGVNSTSTRTGYAEATLLTSQVETDLESHIANDGAPTDRAQVIENVFDGNQKGLGQTSTQIGYSFPLKLNAFNAGYADAGTTTAYVYLTSNPNSVATGTYIGSYSFGDLGAYTLSTQNTNITIPMTVAPGTYYVGYTLGSSLTQYGTDKNSVVIENATMRAYCNGDSYEPDNSSGQPSHIAIGGTQAHSICNNSSGDPRTDKDWATFTLPYASSGTITTTGITGGDTTVTLYNSSLAQVDFNDDNGTNYYSTINRTCASNPLPAGTYYILVQSYNNRSTIPSYTLGLNATACPVSTATTITGSGTSAIYGQPLTFTATVTSTSGTPTGSVTFYDHGVAVGTATLASGKASLVLTLGAGSHYMTVFYNPTSPWTASHSAAVGATVTAASTTTAVASSLNPSTYGRAVTFTATVTPAYGATAAGTVTFKEGSNTLGTASLTANKAALTTATLITGTHVISAVYAGSTNTLGSTSPNLTEPVSIAASTTTLTSSLNPATHGTSVTFKATIVPAYGGTATGTVVFKDGTVTIGQGSVASNTASIATTTLVVGTHSITAVYGGNTNVKGSTSSAVSQVIK